MHTLYPERHCFEFYFPELDTLVRVEESAGTVIVRATKDSFSEMRKLYFIRELAAEGFIPDSYRWFSLAGAESFRGVRWLVDISWVKLSESLTRRTRRFMLSLLSSASLLWLMMMVALLLYQ